MFDNASFSISEMIFSSSSALIVGLLVPSAFGSLADVLKPVSLPLEAIPLLVVLLLLLLLLLLLFVEFVVAVVVGDDDVVDVDVVVFVVDVVDFCFALFSAFDFLPPFSLFSLLLPFLINLPSLLTGDVDKHGQASLFCTGPFCVV